MSRDSKLVEIHAHFLYGIDDGPQESEKMFAMLDAAESDGVRLLFATPHFVPGIEPFDEEKFQQRLSEAKQYCQKNGYQIVLIQGAEVLYTPALEQYIQEHGLPTLGSSRYVLMEFLPNIAFPELLSAITMIERFGGSAVIAHAERYRCLLTPRRLARLKEKTNALIQLNAETVLKPNGWREKHYTRRWLSLGLADTVSSDAHSTHRRPFLLREAYELLTKRYGEEIAHRLCCRSSEEW